MVSITVAKISFFFPPELSPFAYAYTAALILLLFGGDVSSMRAIPEPRVCSCRDFEAYMYTYILFAIYIVSGEPTWRCVK